VQAAAAWSPAQFRFSVWSLKVGGESQPAARVSRLSPQLSKGAVLAEDPPPERK
jgi:hypothetical protein